MQSNTWAISPAASSGTPGNNYDLVVFNGTFTVNHNNQILACRISWDPAAGTTISIYGLRIEYTVSQPLP